MSSSEFDSIGTESGNTNLQVGGGIGSFLKSIFGGENKNSKDITTELAKGNLPVALYLLDRNTPSLSYSDKYGRNALHYLVAFSRDERINAHLKKLIRKSNVAYMNKKDIEGNTPVHIAAYNGFDAIIDAMAKVGADRSIKNKKGLCVMRHDESDDGRRCDDLNEKRHKVHRDKHSHEKGKGKGKAHNPFIIQIVSQLNGNDSAFATDTINMDDVTDTFAPKPHSPPKVNLSASKEPRLTPNKASREAEDNGDNEVVDMLDSVGELPASAPVAPSNTNTNNVDGEVTEDSVRGVFAELNQMKQSDQFEGNTPAAVPVPAPASAAVPTNTNNSSWYDPGTANFIKGMLNDMRGGSMYSATSDDSNEGAMTGGGAFSATSYDPAFDNSEYSDTSDEFSSLQEGAGKKSDELHEKTMAKIKELMKLDDDVMARAYKAALYTKVRNENPELGSLDRAEKLLKSVKKTELKKIPQEKLDEIYQFIVKRDTERAERKKDAPKKAKKTKTKTKSKSKSKSKSKDSDKKEAEATSDSGDYSFSFAGTYSDVSSD